MSYVLLTACVKRGSFGLLERMGATCEPPEPVGKVFAATQEVPTMLLTNAHLERAVEAFPGAIPREWVRQLANLNVASMVTFTRREKTIELGLAALRLGIPGDFVECGTYTGGTAVLMLKTLEAYSKPGSRAFWGADSFRGLPDVSSEDRFKGNTHGRLSNIASHFSGKAGLFVASRSSFEDNLRSHHVWHQSFANVHVLEGWFNETLPRVPIKAISFLRLDGDMYVSTIQPLTYLYPKLQPGGLVYVDDYGSFSGCRNAVEEYRAANNITSPMSEILEPGSDKFEAVWWQKSSVTG